ncbi:MAG: 2-amino-4-hydroxy-6-hydroxymethyldihydropteridine diphosphokinase [Planctomycetes bacterium]|nr:2-amino-4-hydroxy-6-hydroxymethyldihydropteridine diphosphokinase [Planctomycetota bacterium]
MNARRGEVRVFVAVGANLGDRERAFDFALARFAASAGVRVVRRSTWIETEPVGGPVGQPRFLNGVVELGTTLDVRAFFALLQAIEFQAGRDRSRSVRHGPRELDLDLLLFGDLEIDEPDLTVPHPRMGEREFVLGPLAELEPDLARSRRRLSSRVDAR